LVSITFDSGAFFSSLILIRTPLKFSIWHAEANLPQGAVIFSYRQPLYANGLLLSYWLFTSWYVHSLIATD
jgi:hypothetical protein